MGRCTDQRSVFSSRFWNPQRFPCNIIQVRIIPAASHQFYKPLKVIFHLQTEYWPCCVLEKAAPGTVWFTSGLLSNASHFPSCLSEKPSCPPQHRWWWHLCCWNKTRSQFSIPLESNCCRRQVWGRVKKKRKVWGSFLGANGKGFPFENGTSQSAKLLLPCQTHGPFTSGLLQKIWTLGLHGCILESGHKLHLNVFFRVEIVAAHLWGEKKNRIKQKLYSDIHFY